jgi:hypothetical protein
MSIAASQNPNSWPNSAVERGWMGMIGHGRTDPISAGRLAMLPRSAISRTDAMGTEPMERAPRRRWSRKRDPYGCVVVRAPSPGVTESLAVRKYFVFP